MTLTIGSLFSGYGGLTMATEAAIGGELAWVSDVDPGACKILAHRYPDVPNLGDITQVDWAHIEPVDVIEGGSPCQDVSAAGKRAGMRSGTRSGLWASMCDAIDVIRPRLVIWENVRGVLSAHADSAVEPCPICVGDERDAHLRALGRVVGDLSELGYDTAWTGLSASDVGAPHGRFRVFVLAWPADTDGERLARSQSDTSGRLGAADDPRGCGITPADTYGVGPVRSWEPRGRRRRPAHDRLGTATDAKGDGRDEGRPESAGQLRGPHAALSGPSAAAHTDSDALREQPVTLTGSSGEAITGLPGIQWGAYEPAVRRWEHVLDRAAPAPTEAGTKGGQRLSPRFVEWLMGLPDAWVTDVPGLSRNDQLKALGNGVVPQQGAEAIRRLMAHLELEAAA